MSQETALVLFEFVALIFAFTFHEFAHAWTASYFGDQTARMMGRVTLNPIKHLDPVGSVVLPLLSAFTHMPLLGWAKPTPVTTRNLRNIKRDDMLVTLAGPASNLLLAIVSLILLLAIKHIFKSGTDAVFNAVDFRHGLVDASLSGTSVLYPLALLLYCSVVINIVLAIFNLVPIPPLDGSRILRNFLPYNLQQSYDNMGGIISLVVFLLLIRTPILGWFYMPVLAIFDHLIVLA
jgi:Zn-dependent protease